MFKNRRLLWVLVSFVLVVSALLLPLTASAGRFTRERGFMFVPANATIPYTLTVGQVSVTIPPGAMPQGGPVILFVVTSADGWFMAEFLPERAFAQPVLMDFGSVRDETVYYHDGGALVPLRTQGGKLWSPHFSRYSGWH